MKRKLLKTLAIGLLAMVGVNAAWADDVVEVITPSVDGWIRYTSNTAKNYESAEYETKHYTKDATDNDFYAVMKFAIPNKVGMQIKSASLRLVTKKSGAKTSMAVYKLTDELTTSSSYSTLTNIATDLGGTALGTFTIAQGERSKQLGTDNLTKEEYSSPISKWTNNITLDKSKVTMGSDLGLVIAITGDRDGSDGSVNKFFSSRATNITIANAENSNTTTYAKGQLIPQLTITYEPADGYKVIKETSTADGYVRGDGDNKSKSFSGNVQLLNKSDGAQMYGYMTFNLAAQPGYELVSASLRLTGKRVKDDRLINIYALDGSTAETATYNSLSSTIESPGDALFENYSVQGGNLEMTSDEITDAYAVISAWQNTFDLTSHVSSITATNFGLLFKRVSTTAGQEIHFFTRESTSVSNSKDAKSTAFVGSLSADDIQPRLVLVYKKMDSYKLPVTSAGAATLCLPFDATIPTDGDLKAYTLSYTSGDNITATQITTGTLTADTPVLITADENASGYEFTRTGEITDGTPTSDILTGVYTETVVPADNYILTNHSGNVGFRKANGTTNKVKAYRAYMTASYSSGAPAFLGIDFTGGNTTAIDAVEQKTLTDDGAIYNLQGVRMNGGNLKKGIYVKNGRKFVVK